MVYDEAERVWKIGLIDDNGNSAGHFMADHWTRWGGGVYPGRPKAGHCETLFLGLNPGDWSYLVFCHDLTPESETKLRQLKKKLNDVGPNERTYYEQLLEEQE